MNLKRLAKHFSDDEAARAYFEGLRWPKGPVCPRCGADKPYKLTSRPTAKQPVRPGVYKCRGCRKPFSVTVGTIMERSHIPLSTWLLAFHLMSSSKKGFSAHQMHREFGLDYKSAWFMAHRIREAMKRPPLSGKLKGIVEADEAYIGGRPRAYEKGKVGRPGPTSKKTPVVSLVERSGDVRSFHMERVTADTVRPLLREHIEQSARLMTDDFNPYRGMGREFASHESVNHSANEYVRGEAHTQTVEGYFSLLKRGINGTFHHVSRKHLGRYLHEFDFRYNARKVSDGERTERAIRGAEGRRLMYREPVAAALLR
jgi:transposase-like protein